MNSQSNVLTSRSVISLVLTLAFLAHNATAQTQQLCPGCYKNQEPFPGRYGPASSTDPRRLIKIKIGASWNVDNSGNATGQTNPTIWNALNDQNSGSGTSMWNNARDGSATTSVYFQLDQVSDPDIIIKLGPVANGGCAQTDITKKPYVMTLPLRAASWTPTQIALIVAHELGHTIGLAHAVNYPGETIAPDCPPPGVKSVMKGAPYSTCQPVFTGIEPTDVRAHNIQFQSRLTSCRVSTAGGYAPTPDENPGGDPCPNCNPPPPSCFTNSNVYISSDGLGCYHVVYVDETYCDGLFVSSTTYAWDVCTTGYLNP